MQDVRIQIVNYKTKAYLSECLASIYKDLSDARISYSVAVLDNASGDDLSDLRQRFSGKPLDVIMNASNVGFGAGHNILARGASARYLLFVNPDTLCAEPHSIECLLHKAEEAGAAVAGPRLMTDHGSTQRYDHAELDGLQASVALHTGHAYWKDRRESIRAAWTCGAFFLIKKEWFDRVDGFDANIFLYREEEELCWRVRAEGGVILYIPEIKVFHKGGVVAKKNTIHA